MTEQSASVVLQLNNGRSLSIELCKDTLDSLSVDSSRLANFPSKDIYYTLEGPLEVGPDGDFVLKLSAEWAVPFVLHRWSP